jgi:hypothetical protein
VDVCARFLTCDVQKRRRRIWYETSFDKRISTVVVVSTAPDKHDNDQSLVSDVYTVLARGGYPLVGLPSHVPTIRKGRDPGLLLLPAPPVRSLVSFHMPSIRSQSRAEP